MIFDSSFGHIDYGNHKLLGPLTGFLYDHCGRQYHALNVNNVVVRNNIWYSAYLKQIYAWSSESSAENLYEARIVFSLEV